MKYLILVIVLIAIFSSCAMSPEEPVTVRYRLSGTVATAEVEYLNTANEMINLGEVDIPWETTEQIWPGSYAEITGTKVTCGGMLSAYVITDEDYWHDSTEEPHGAVNVRVKI